MQQVIEPVSWFSRSFRQKVKNMQSLCERVLPLTAELVVDLRTKESVLLDHLGNGWPVLLPYDCDANHSPTTRSGKRAHWAVLLGFALVSPLDASDPTRPDATVRMMPPLSPEDRELVRSRCLARDRVFLMARQGKSQLIGLWDFVSLCESNENLIQVNERLDSASHVLPVSGDLSSSLARQLLFIQPKTVIEERQSQSMDASA